MEEITPQDLNNSLSVLEFLSNYAETTGNTEMKTEVDKLISDYNQVIAEPDLSDMTLLPYNRKDAYSILEYLKLQAEQLSEGRWTDFSDSDIGTVFLKLMSYLADMNNFQVDKVASELYLSTCTERASAIALCSLIGYEPRHYQSASSTITLTNAAGRDIPNGTVIPAYSVFTNSLSTVKYCNLEQQTFYNNQATFDVYEGTPASYTYTINNISTLGRIILNDYNVATNTISVTINGIKYQQVDDVRFISGELGYSVHISEDRYLYIQLPSYWPDVISQSSVIEISYLLSNGSSGRIGSNVLTRVEQLLSDQKNNVIIAGNTASIGGYNPETVDEMKISVPRQARTMNTIVTINDFEEVSLNVLGIADVSALDYNDPSSGLVQPDDYYKVYMYVLPDADTYDASDEELIKYRNTIIKAEEDWTLEDMNNVAEGLDTYSKVSITGSVITLTGASKIYTKHDIVPSIDTGDESTSYLITNLTTSRDTEPEIPPLVPPEYQDTLYCWVEKSGDDLEVHLCSDWKDFVEDGQKINIYYKREQVLTERGQALREYVDERRLTSLNVTYHDLDIVQPTIEVDVYMDKDDIRFNTTASQIKDFIVDKYSRKNLKIGEPIFASVIGADILTNFDYIRYCEVRDPEEKIEVLPRGFIDVVPNVMQDGELVDKVIVTMHDYKNRTI